MYRYFARNTRDAICAFKFAPSRHAFDLHTFFRLIWAFVDRWWLKEVWYAPDFLSTCSTCVPVAAPGKTGSPSKRICRSTLSQKTRKWPTCKPVHVHERSRERRSSFDLAYSRSTTGLSWSLASEATRLDAHIHGKLGCTLSSLTKKHIPRRPCCSLELNRRSGATVPSRESELVRSSSFAKKNNEEVSGWYHASKYWLFAIFARLIFQVLVSVPVACRRLLRGADFSACADDGSGLRVADPASISTISEPRKTTREEMLAKKVKAWHRRRRVGPQTERANQLSRAKTCAGWAPHWLHRLEQPARWINFRSFAKACHGKSFYSGFLFFLEQQLAHKYYMLTKNQERTTLPSTTSNRQRGRVKHKNVCKSKAWRDGANLKAHIASRAFPREIPVRGRFFQTPFSITFRWRIFLKPTEID